MNALKVRHEVSATVDSMLGKLQAIPRREVSDIARYDIRPLPSRCRHHDMYSPQSYNPTLRRREPPHVST